MTPQELKNSIWQLAVQGKLVEQRPEDGTSEEFLQQIQAEKQALIKTGTIKTEKPLPEITEDEIPYEIPENWRWVRLGDYCQKVTDQVASGSFASLRENVPSLKDPNYAVMVKTADFANGFSRNLTYTTKHGYEFLENSNLFGGELILSNIGSIGKCFIVPDLGCKMTLAPNAVMIRVVNNEHRDYLYHFLLSPSGYQALLSITSGTAMKKFNKTDLKKILLPIPPLAEQKRIVAKLEEILPLIDRYEAAWNKLDEFNKRFPGDMQKSILQLAIQGKLVEQRPEEGTGEELFQQIQEEKQALVKAGKLKKEKPLPEIAEDEIPFEIPDTWQWARLGNISWYFDAGKSPNCLKQPVTGNDWGVITTTAVQLGYFDEVQNKILPSNFAVNPEIQVRSGDILITRAGPTNRTGIACLVKDIHYKLILSDKIIRINMTDNYFYKDYLIMVLNSPRIRNLIVGLMSGMDKQQVNVSQDKYKTLLIPIPPLAEQKRIVAKLEEILPLCDRLK